MSVTREDLVMVVGTAKRREWLRPTLRRLAAGSAEDAVNGAPDGLNPS